MTNQQIIDEIERMRRLNNTNWMDLLRLCVRIAPQETKAIMTKITANDQAISALTAKLGG